MTDRNRHIALEAGNNFRDFGGYRTRRGRAVKWRQLFRSGHLGMLTDEDKAALAELEIKLVCDFRTQQERDGMPTRLAEHHAHSNVHLPIDPGNMHDFLELLRTEKNQEERISSVGELFVRINHSLAVDKTAEYQQMFSAILNSNGPVLIHCSAGRDRTGFGAAVILSALGVPENKILDDYLLTNKFQNIPMFIQWFRNKLDIDAEPAAIRHVAQVDERFLQAGFDAINSHYGDMQTYLTESLKLDTAAINELQERFLE